MSSVVVSIPKAGKIEVPNPAPITPLEFVKQVVDNVKAQLESLDSELQRAGSGDTDQVFYCTCMFPSEKRSANRHRFSDQSFS